jgi:osmotically-inducible protein OsmY
MTTKRTVSSALLALLLAAPLAVLLPACGAATSQVASDDPTITTRVKTALINDPAVGAARIDVATTRGVVTLSGRVRSKDEEAKAVAVARSIRGVADVKSTLEIQP